MKTNRVLLIKFFNPNNQAYFLHKWELSLETTNFKYIQLHIISLALDPTFRLYRFSRLNKLTFCEWMFVEWKRKTDLQQSLSASHSSISFLHPNKHLESKHIICWTLKQHTNLKQNRKQSDNTISQSFLSSGCGGSKGEMFYVCSLFAPWLMKMVVDLQGFGGS